MLEITMSRMLYFGRDSLRLMTLAERVKEAVQATRDEGHSVLQIAQACGITPQAVYQWLDGATKSIAGENLVELAELSGYHARWIAKGKEPKFEARSVRQALKLLRQMPPESQAIAVKIIAPLVEQKIDEAPPFPARKTKGQQ